MSRMRMLAALAALGSCCFLASLSAAVDDKKEDKASKEDKVASADRDFVAKASASGLAEVNLSNLALTRSRDPAVREFAQQMVTDHTTANRALIEWANRQQAPVAKAMDEKHQKLFEELSKAEGADFDRKYLDGMVKDHEEAVKLFETQAKEGKDEGLKSWADKTLPTLKKHLEKARNLGEKSEKDKDKKETRKDETRKDDRDK